MPRYEIKQYYTCTQTFRVDAESPAEAIAEFTAGKGKNMRQMPAGLNVVEVNEEVGMSLEDQDEELAEALIDLRCCDKESNFVPSIHSIVEAE